MKASFRKLRHDSVIFQTIIHVVLSRLWYYDVSSQLGLRVCHACYVGRNRRQVPRTCTEIIMCISEYA